MNKNLKDFLGGIVGTLMGLIIALVILTIFGLLSPIDCNAQETAFSDSITYKPPVVTIKEKKINYKKEAYEIAVLGTIMYIFRDPLNELSRKHNKLTHVILGYGLTKKFGWKATVGFFLGKEAAQIDTFGMKGRKKDTFYDLLMGSIGINLAIKF